MRRILVMAVALTALAPATASAGGWATVGLSSTPDGLPSGTPWVVEIEVRQHGQTPLAGVSPAVIVTSPKGVDAPPVTATATGTPGIYRAQVRFPAAGEWTYAVDDGFGRVHHFPPAAIRPGGDAAAGGAREDATSWTDLLLAAIAGLAAAGAVALARRHRPHRAGTAAPSGA